MSRASLHRARLLRTPPLPDGGNWGFAQKQAGNPAETFWGKQERAIDGTSKKKHNNIESFKVGEMCSAMGGLHGKRLFSASGWTSL
jgi:hypothetical protein